MRLFKFATCFAAVAAIALVSNVQGQNLLGNSSFESPLLPLAAPSVNGNFAPFTGSSGGPIPVDPVPTTTNPLTGAQSLEIAFAGEGAAFSGVQQSVFGLAAGTPVTLTVNAVSDGGNLGVNAEFRIEYLDAVGGFLGGGQFANNDDFTNSLSNTFTTFTQTSLVPAGTFETRAVLAGQSFGGGVEGSTDDIGTVFFDDINLVPEPSALGMLALGIAGVASRRRRR